MSSGNNQPAGGRTNSTGTKYSTPTSGPAPTGTPVTITTPNGGVPGWLNGNTVVKTDRP